MGRIARRLMGLNVLFSAVLIASMPMGAIGGDGDTDGLEQHDVITNDEALREDALQYSADFGVSLEEAIHRLSIQIPLSDVIAEIEKASGERFAGGWIEHTPKFRGVVSLTGDGSLPVGVANLATSAPAPVDIITGAPNSLADLLAGQRRAAEYLRGIGLRATSDVDVRTGSVVVTTERALLSPAWAALTAATGVKVRSEVGQMPSEQHTYGGRTLKVGSSLECTTGFTVSYQGTGERAVVTAAHCADSLTYYQTATTSYALTFRGAMDDTNQDVQWHTNSSHGTYDDSWDGDSYRDVTGTHTRSGSIGTFLCHYGAGSNPNQPPLGYSCGTVWSITFDDGACGPNNGPCDDVWVRVNSEGALACWGGDSGGPWFASGTAYGIHRGGASFGTLKGDCSYAVYMSVDLLPPMALYVLTQ